jgi:RNA polymerase sigma-70 factor (ECF subfamily)
MGPATFDLAVHANDSPSARRAGSGVGPTDAELVAMVHARDERAVALAYDRHADVVYGALVRFVGDRETAQDVVQETFLALWQRGHLFDPEAGSLLGWLLGIARNKAIDRFRAARRRPQIVAPWPRQDEPTDRGPLAGGRIQADLPVDEDPEASAAREWLRATVRTALSAMPDAERRVLQLAYDGGLSQSEIAARLGWPLGTVKTRTRRALAALREVLGDVPDVAPRSTESGADRAGAPASGTAAAGAADARGDDDGPR